MKKLLLLLLITAFANECYAYTYTNVDIKWNADTGGGNVSISQNPVVRTNVTDQGYAVLVKNPITPSIESKKEPQPDWYEGWTERHANQKEKKHEKSHVVTRVGL